jgi:hypothetical protein
MGCRGLWILWEEHHRFDKLRHFDGKIPEKYI